MISTCAELVRAYFVQLTEGCDKLDCYESECLRCASFRHEFYDPNDVAMVALCLARGHTHEPHLCKGVDPLKVDLSLAVKVKGFDECIRKLMKGGAFDDDAFAVISEGLSDYRIFSCIMKTNEKRLSEDNIALDDDTVNDIVNVVTEHAWFFQQAQNKFCQLVTSIVAEQCPNTFTHIRALFLVMLFEGFFNRETIDTVFIPLVLHFLELPDRVINLMKKYLVKLPSLLKSFNTVVTLSVEKFVQKYAMSRNIEEDPIVYHIAKYADFMSKISDSANMTLSWSDADFTDLFNVDIEFTRFQNKQHSMLDFPAILSLDFKTEAYVRGIPPKRQHTIHTIRIDRSHIVEDAIAQFQSISMHNLNTKLVIKFIGEDGVDEGGVTREFFHLLFNKLLSPDYGMFELIDNKFYWFKQMVMEQPEAFELIGSIISIAIYHSIILPFRFPLLFYKKLFHREIELEDLREVQPSLVRSFEQIKEMAENHQDVRDLGLTFSVVVDDFGRHTEIDLVEEGRNIEVNNENYQIYIDSYIEWYVHESIRVQFDAFERGFYRLCNSDFLKIFSPHEIDVLVSGEEVYDWDEMKRFCKYSDGYSEDSKQVKWFWEVFNDMSLKDKKKWLQFVTGSDRAPCGGLKELEITIQRDNDPTKWPVSHSCFNIFTLPTYKSKKVLKENVIRAIQYSEGFGIM